MCEGPLSTISLDDDGRVSFARPLINLKQTCDRPGVRMCAKVITLGTTNVGKTSLIDCLSIGLVGLRHTGTFKNTGTLFDSLYYEVEGQIFDESQINNQNKVCGDLSINLLDTAGQERYRSLTATYFRDVDIAFLVFDIQELEQSYSSLCKDWILSEDNRCFITQCQRNNVVPIWIANKCDTVEQLDQAKKHEHVIRDYCKNLDNRFTPLRYFTISCFNGRGMQSLAQELKTIFRELFDFKKKEHVEQKRYSRSVELIPPPINAQHQRIPSQAYGCGC